ncbi:hypothetical protein BCR42DRAFT_317037 [Absidia repens]|uniref:SET domain-containing protein n=1 Tax=Absidia repens TaxID=90262 RepID=A0A1X2IZK3_9FUNG|nr:hypothetical protein BCR42DRAFT_317037 [Absidia repens]
MTDTDLDAYATWIKEHGGSFGKVHVFASEPIDTNESFATVPFKLAITELVARTAFPQLDDFSCRIVLTLFVAHQKAIGTSFYAPYLNILPQSIKTPFFFDDNDMAYLEHTNVALAIKERVYNLRADYDRLLELPIGEDVKSLDLFLWAHCAISSRSFPYKLIDPNHLGSSEVLFPLVDSLNHKPNTKITWSRSGDAENGSLSFVAGQPFAAGEQVFNNYGPKVINNIGNDCIQEEQY